MVAVLDRVGSILFIVVWHRLNKSSKESGQQLRGSIRFQSGRVHPWVSSRERVF